MKTALALRLAELIRKNGPIPFSQYMEACLYDAELGYYAQPRERFGKAGDFYTSSDVSAVFGRLLCRQFEEMWRGLGSPARVDMVELGPGRGFFAEDVLSWAEKKFPEFASALRYRLVETSAELRARIGERLQRYVDAGRATTYATFDEAAAECGETAIVFGNEFFDALPVEVLTGAGQVYVGVDGDGKFIEEPRAAPEMVLEFAERFSVCPEEGQRIEAALAAQEWMRRVASFFGSRSGYCVFVDYGYTREEQLAGRHLDTLMTYRSHHAEADLYAVPGEQDITAHVNFTALSTTAEEAGMRREGLVTQSQLLLGIGEATQFSDVFDECKLPQERAKRAMQLKHLATPAGIGEIFHVLVLSRGVEGSLSGLGFGKAQH
jgi:SAM-dependent MidA family methyltransferase